MQYNARPSNCPHTYSTTHSHTRCFVQVHGISRSKRRGCLLQLACPSCRFHDWSVCNRDSCLDLRNRLHHDRHTTITLKDRDGQELHVNVVMEGEDGSVLHMRLFMYVSFWVINRTGINLLYAEAKQVRWVSIVLEHYCFQMRAYNIQPISCIGGCDVQFSVLNTTDPR